MTISVSYTHLDVYKRQIDSTGQKLEEDEEIEGYVWKSYEEIIDRLSYCCNLLH